MAAHILDDRILDKTMHLFWEKGYFNTSIEDIVEVTGVNRAALYKYFDGKHGLFLAMLKRFRCSVIQSATAPLTNPARGIDAITSFFHQFLDPDSKMSSHGCFIIATASDIPSHHHEIAAVVNDFISHLRHLFRDIFKFMKFHEQLNSNDDPNALADFLVCNVLGLVTIFRSGADKAIARYHVQTVNRFLANLQQEKSR